LADQPTGLSGSFGDKTVPGDEAVDHAPDEELQKIEEHWKTSEEITDNQCCNAANGAGVPRTWATFAGGTRG